MYEYLQTWELSDADRKMLELAERYHAECEAYDRTVCTGPIVHGEIMPNGPRELGLVNRNAKLVWDQLMAHAVKCGIDRKEMARAIRQRK